MKSLTQKMSVRALFILAVSVASWLLMYIVAHAQGGFVALSDANFENIFNIPEGTSGSGNLGIFANGAFKTALSVGAILAVLRIAYAGYTYMTSDAWGNKTHAKEILGDVVLGLLLLLGTYLILDTINPKILEVPSLQNVEKVTTK